jgi:hypothetical protein
MLFAKGCQYLREFVRELSIFRHYNKSAKRIAITFYTLVSLPIHLRQLHRGCLINMRTGNFFAILCRNLNPNLETKKILIDLKT